MRGHRAVLEAARQMLGLVGVAGHQRLLDLVGIGLRLFGHQRIADPKPHRLERGARDPAAMLVIGTVVDQERLDRLEEQPRRIAEALRLGCAVAQAAPQLGQDQFGAGGSSPRNSPRSSSAISKARAPGFKSRRKSRSCSAAGCPRPAIPAPFAQ